MSSEKWIFGKKGAKIDKRGRPRGYGKEYNYLRDEKGYGTAPEEIVLSEDAPADLLVVASLANFLNGYELDGNVERMCSRWGLDAKKIAKDRVTYSIQIQSIRDTLHEQYRDKIMDLASWMMNETTSGQGSVMAAMTGDYTQYGNPRNK